MTNDTPRHLAILVALMLAVHNPITSLAGDLLPGSIFSPDVHMNRSQGTIADEAAALLFTSDQIDLGVLPDAADVDAVHLLSTSEVLFSLESSVVLDGVLYRPCDVIRFDGALWSKEFDGRAEGIPDGVNVDAIAMSGANLLVSFKTSGDLGGVNYRDEDLLAWASPDWSQVFDGSSADPAWLPVDLDAWSVVFIGDDIFKDGFELD